MVKAYLRYEQVAGFGVVSSNEVPVRQINNDGSAPLIASAAVDVLVVWNLRTANAVARFGNEETRKAGAITALAVSPSGNYVATGYSDGSIRLWSFNSETSAISSLTPFSDSAPQPTATFNGHRSAVSSLAFESVPVASTNPKKSTVADLVSGSNDGDIIMWNIVDESGKFRLSAHTDKVTALLLFRKDDDSLLYIVSASKDALVKVYDVETQHCVQTIANHRAEVWAMQLDPLRSLLFTGGDGADVWVYSLVGKSDPASSPNNGTDSASASVPVDDLLSYDAERVFKSLGHIERHVATNRVASIECTLRSGERYVVVSAANKHAEIFRCRNPSDADVHRKRRHNREIASIEKTLDATAEDENWDAAKKKEELHDRLKDLDTSLSAVDFLVSTRQLRMGRKLRSIEFLTERTYIPVRKGLGTKLQLLVQQRDNSLEVHSVTLKPHKSRKRKIDAGSNFDVLNEDFEGEIEEEVEKILTLDFPGHRSDVRALSLSPDETMLLSASDGALKLWNVATEKYIRGMRFSGNGLCTQFLGADGGVGVVGTKDGLVQVYDLRSGGMIATVKAHQGEVRTMCLDDHVYEANYLLTGGSDKRVCFWSIEDVLVGATGKLELHRVLEMPDQVLCVRVAYGRERPVVLVSMMDSTVRAYFLDDLKPYLSFYGHNLPVMSMDVSSDGLMLATGSADKTVKLWGMDFGDCRRSLRAHTDSVLSVAFQPKTHYLFSASKDGSLKYWDGDKFEFICDIEGQRGEVWAMALSSDGEIVSTAGGDRMIRVWRRTDEPLFLDEEKDRRMEDLFESKLIEEDVLEAKKAKDNVGFMANATAGESSAAGKRSMETIKRGEQLLEALQLCEEETVRVESGLDEGPNPLLLGLTPESYILRTLNGIRSADLEESLHILPLDAAMRLLQLITMLLLPEKKISRLSVEMLTRAGLFLVRLHEKQICAGAAKRNVISDLYSSMRTRIKAVRARLGYNSAALQFWQQELGERDDRPFRDASARAYNMEHARIQKSKQALRNANRKETTEECEESDN